jgi:sec-independent protein translocase protein TatA
MFPGVGLSEMMVVFVVILLLFGSKNLPGLARRFGKTMRQFKKAADDVKKEIDINDDFKF